MDSALLDLIKTLGVPIAVLLFVLWLFLRGKLHSDGEYQEMKNQRDYYRGLTERSVSVTEATVPVVKQAVQKRAEVTNLEDMASVVDEARQRGLIG
jgi:hypothetical protein